MSEMFTMPGGVNDSPVLGAAIGSALMVSPTVMPIVGHTFAQRPKFKVIKMLFIDAGTYNEQYMRAFETMVDKDVADKLQLILDNHAGVNSLTASAMGTFVPSFMKVSASPQAAAVIPGGWGEKRLRFQLVVEEMGSLIGTSRIRHIFQGFTESHGVSLSGLLDPKMFLFINSFMKVSREEVMTPYGRQFSERVIESGQVMDPNLLRSTSPQVQMMRPADLMSHNSNAYALNYAKSSIGDMGMLIDGRSVISNSSLFSNRQNNVSTNYVAHTVNAMKYAQGIAGFGDNNDQTFDTAFGKLYTGSHTENQFLMALGAQLGITGPIGKFTLEKLKIIDPDFQPQYGVMEGMALQNMHRAGQTENWGAPTLVTQAAATLANAVPSLAADLLIHSAEFTATNSMIGGGFNITWVDIKSSSGDQIDLVRCANIFAERFRTEIADPLSHGNQLTYAFTVRYNIFDDIRLSIALDNSGKIDYAMPSFADAILPPVVASNANHVNAVAHDMEKLFGSVDWNTINGSFALNTDIPAPL